MDQRSEQEALNAAQQACQADGGQRRPGAPMRNSFQQCAAVVFGTEHLTSPAQSSTLSPHDASTLAAAESDALTYCRSQWGSCTIAASGCNSRLRRAARAGEAGRRRPAARRDRPAARRRHERRRGARNRQGRPASPRSCSHRGGGRAENYESSACTASRGCVRFQHLQIARSRFASPRRKNGRGGTSLPCLVPWEGWLAHG